VVGGVIHNDGVRLGIADHFGWAVAVTAAPDHAVVDRRRIELVEPGMSAAPIHYESRRLDVAATAALVARVRASVERACSAALDDLAGALPMPLVSISLRLWPPDFPDDIAVRRRAPYEARADAIMYRQLLAELAHARGWEVHCYDAKHVEAQAADLLGKRADEILRGPGQCSARPGRRTTGWHSLRQSWPATGIDQAALFGPSAVTAGYLMLATHLARIAPAPSPAVCRD
jgi:hypothetical protein